MGLYAQLLMSFRLVGFASHSPQCRKALKASFPPDRWPATEVTDPDGSLRFVLKDGTEIHRTGPPTQPAFCQTPESSYMCFKFQQSLFGSALIGTAMN